MSTRVPSDAAFTDRARKVLTTANSEAVRLHHDCVGTEHILIGLAHDEDGVAAAVLRGLGVEVSTIPEPAAPFTTAGATSQSGSRPYTTQAEHALKLAQMAVVAFGHTYIGTEHLLLGLLEEEQGHAAQILNGLGVTAQAAREETHRLLDDPPQ